MKYAHASGIGGVIFLLEYFSKTKHSARGDDKKFVQTNADLSAEKKFNCTAPQEVIES